MKNAGSKCVIYVYERLLIVACLILIGFASFSGYQAYFYTLFCFCLLNKFCDRGARRKNFLYFHFYLIIAFVLYFFQKAQFPEYMGLTGPYGTDDLSYYAGLGAKITYSDPRPHIAELNTLSPLIKLLYIPTIYDPIDIIIFNILGITFIPYLTNKTSYVFLEDEKAAYLAERLILFCPFMMSVGLIIMRDVLCSTLVLTAFLCFEKRKFVFFCFLVGLILYLKLGYIVFLCVILSIYLIMQEKLISKSKTWAFIKIVMAAFIFLIAFVTIILPNLSEITGGRLTPESLFRESFIDYLQDNNEGSSLAKIYQLPLIIKLPLLIIAFFVIPPLSPDFIREGYFSIGAFMQNFLSPIYWFFVYIFFFDFCFSYRKLSTQAKCVLYISVLLALALGMISLQTRHKVVLMPFIYIIISYAVTNEMRKKRYLSAICVFLLIVSQLLFFGSRL